jgi:predicted nucleic acid-binding protein
MSVSVVYDAGALIAIDNNDRRMWGIHQLAVDEGRRIVVPAVVVGQVWRDARRQVRLGQLLQSCEVEPVRVEVAKAAGVLCGKAKTNDVVDAIVVTTALALGAIVFTSDPKDIAALATESGARPGISIRAV